jgi:hypothetical protein
LSANSRTILSSFDGGHLSVLLSGDEVVEQEDTHRAKANQRRDHSNPGNGAAICTAAAAAAAAAAAVSPVNGAKQAVWRGDTALSGLLEVSCFQSDQYQYGLV